ncbi:MAG: DUF2087 domain-containing protein [Rhodobacteraceae bacterium]|nr:DUF2087 domain-containing protein [Paracoccaceae bacterium]
MTRTPLPLYAADLTTFSRALARQLGEEAPSHLTLMNMLARAAGFENIQHMRSAQAAARRLEREEEARPLDARIVERALQQFDADRRLREWPSKRAIQTLSLWVLWARLPAQRDMTEKQVNAALHTAHAFEDPATLRRTMIAERLLTRETDGSVYRRIEARPPEEALALIRQLDKRCR